MSETNQNPYATIDSAEWASALNMMPASVFDWTSLQQVNVAQSAAMSEHLMMNAERARRISRYLPWRSAEKDYGI